MAIEWINDGEPVDGIVSGRITFEDGRQPQVFKGTNYKEVATHLLQAQEHATNAIKTLRAGQQIEPARPRKRAQTKPMTAGERMEVAADLQDPARADKAVTRIVEATVGPVESIREVINKTDEDEAAAEAAVEAQAFADYTPDWYPTQYNKETIVAYMQKFDIAPTRNNFSIVFQQLTDAGLLQKKPAAPSPEEESPANGQPNGSGLPPQGGLPVQPTTRPRGTLLTTAIRTQDTSGGSAPRPRPKYTRADIETMPLATYKSKLESEPGFGDLVAAVMK